MEIPKRIIEKYSGITRNDYIFPVPSNATCNSYVKKLMEEAEIITEQKVTFHTARHTFATMFLTEGVPLESLSKRRGHKNIPLHRLMPGLQVRKSVRIWIWYPINSLECRLHLLKWKKKILFKMITTYKLKQATICFLPNGKSFHL